MCRLFTTGDHNLCSCTHGLPVAIGSSRLTLTCVRSSSHSRSQLPALQGPRMVSTGVQCSACAAGRQVTLPAVACKLLCPSGSERMCARSRTATGLGAMYAAMAWSQPTAPAVSTARPAGCQGSPLPPPTASTACKEGSPSMSPSPVRPAHQAASLLMPRRAATPASPGRASTQEVPAV